jgi:enterochelin esterase-like enzyme
MHAACMLAGFSRGGYSAAALASRSPEATHALVMHSSVTTNQARHDSTATAPECVLVMSIYCAFIKHQLITWFSVACRSARM